MPNLPDSEWTTEPFRMGTAEEFARFRTLLVRSGFTEREICERAGVPSMHSFSPAAQDRTVFRDAIDAQSLFVRLFIDCASVPWTTVREILSPPDLETVEALGLLHTSPIDGGCDATVDLYPTNEVYIASDRHLALHVTGANPPSDLVYSAMTKETHRLLKLMPHIPCEDFLEVCSGTGVAALIAGGHFAKRAVAIDITERCTRFARFNVALNGLSQVTVLRGDLYAPVAGRTFDLIVAHPPYVPSFETEYVYRDGGEDGEQVTRRVIAALPQYLRPGGQFFCDCMMSDRTAAPLQERIREMLGDHAPEFDVIIGQAQSFEPIAYYAEQARHGKISFSSIERRHQAFSHFGIERFVSVSMLFRRTTSSRSVVTTRRMLSSRTSREDFQWLLQWGSATAAWGAEEARRLLECRPRAVPLIELRSRSTLHGNQWLIEESRLIAAAPFAFDVSCPFWFANLLMWCDGRTTGRELLARVRELGVVPPNDVEDAFASMIRQLVDAGMIEIEEFPLPNETAMRSASESDSADIEGIVPTQ